MDKICNLLFELSSEDRMNILLLLKKSPLKLSHISDKLDFTVQETARNISRLSDAKLIAKDVNGLFHLTPYGEETLNLLSGYRFLLKNRDYFLTHSVAALPTRFESSLGVFEDAEFVGDIMIMFHNVENTIAEAEKSVCILTNQILASTLPYLTEAMERGVTFQLIMPQNYLPTMEIRKLVNTPAFERAARAGKMDFHFIGKVDAFICFSEKQVAAFGLVNLEGKFDYAGFKTQGSAAIEWVKDLFTFYWERSSDKIPDQLFTS